MITINKNYLNLKESYLFTEIAHRVAEFSSENPNADIIKLGIGDVTKPLCKAVVDEMVKASQEMGTPEGFHGYGPEQGYDFLKKAVKVYYADYGVDLEENEIFISDGAKSDIGNILDILGKDNTVLIPDPVYPVYVDTNIMDAREVIFADSNESNGFLPLPNENTIGDIIYICSPNNPTGAVYSKEQLKKWVDFANANKSLILFDAAYESFVTGDYPHSIFEIEGSETCAIEFCSLSKTAGFTGTRCGYTIVPNKLTVDGTALNKLWLRRQTTKFNGVSYIVQRGASAVFTADGQKQIKENIEYYKQNAKIITDAFDELGIWYTGGKNSPYVWMKCPNGMSSWDFFDKLLKEANVVGTPGAGFGENGEGFFRLTAFNTKEKTEEAVKRIKQIL